MPIIEVARLTRFVVELFQAAGVSKAESEQVTGSLVEANLRGHDSHGVVRVNSYIEGIKGGAVVPGAELEILSETGAAIVTDAHFGFGQVQCINLLERLAPKARQQGIACGTMIRSGHVGRLGEWLERAALKGLAGLMSVTDNGVLKCVAPPGGTAPRISTNPIAIGVPTVGKPLIADISTSVVANGKIRVALLAGQQCPPGWLLDAEGNPTTDPSVRFTDPAGTILPLGGEGHGYKGFGLGMLLDILVGGLSGGQCPPAPEGTPGTNSVLLILWDPGTFAGQSHFLSQSDKLIDFVRTTPRKPGTKEIRLPGDRSAALEKQRTKEGIPLDEGTWQALVSLAGKMNVRVP